MKTLFSLLIISLSYGETLPFKEPQGWLWYKEAPTLLKKASPIKKKRTPTEEVEVLKKEFEEATALAILTPSFENVQKAQRLQTQIMNRAETFSKMWQWVVLQDASHWQEASHSNRVHREIYKEEEEKKLKKNLKTLAKSYGLFLFFKTNCAYCHAFAPIVKMFADQYGFVVKAVSADGGTLKEFPSSVMDNGTIRKLNPEGIFPALFLINPATNDVIPLSWGMNSLSVLEQQSNLIFEHRRDLA